MQISGWRERPGHDIAVAHRERWLATLAVVATGAAMLATSEPPRHTYSFQKSVVGPAVVLSADAPSARFRVTARATELAPNGSPTTGDTFANVKGVVTQLDGAKFVTARVTSNESAAGNELAVLNDFALPAGLAFEGDCETLSAADPCEASFLVEFERPDRGETGGTVSVSWTLDFGSRVLKEGQNEGPLELPWSVELTQQ